MIDSACNYLNPYATASLAASTTQSSASSSSSLTNANEFSPLTAAASVLYNSKTSVSASSVSSCNPMKLEMQYPPQPSSAGSASSPNSSSQSTPSSTSVSPSIFPSPAQSFASISSSPPVSATSASPLSGSHTELGAAAAASAAYTWNTAAYTAALPTRTQFPYAQYASDYYGNAVGMSAASAAAGAWFSHQDRLYQPWSGQTYPSFNFDDIAFQTQLQRRSVRCTCPNCTNEMSGLPPIVGPDERGRKQHICHIPGCERLYGKASHLKTHLRWHTGERPFLCLTCGKRFSRSDELQRHGRTHTNYRPYACPICSKKFSRSDHLSKHKKTHFKDKKSKKALATEAKGQAANIKQEKALEQQQTEKSSPAKSPNMANGMPNTPTASAATTTVKSPLSLNNRLNNNNNIQTHQQRPQHQQQSQQQQSVVPQIHLKTEQSDQPINYTPYTNLYHQASTLFQPHLTSSTSYGTTNTAASSVQNTPPTFELWNTQQQLQSRSAMEQSQQQRSNNSNNNATATTVTTSSNGHLEQSRNVQTQHQQSSQNQQQQQQHSQTSQHYNTLAMQSETQLANEYGVTMSSSNSLNGGTSHISHHHPHHPHSHSHHHHHMQHPMPHHMQHSTTYSNLLGQMKSEYPPYADFSSTSTYATPPSAFHHHPHNPWTTATAYQHPHHATA